MTPQRSSSRFSNAGWDTVQNQGNKLENKQKKRPVTWTLKPDTVIQSRLGTFRTMKQRTIGLDLYLIPLKFPSCATWEFKFH